MSERLGFSPQIEKGSELVNRVKQIEVFRRQPYSLEPYAQTASLVDDLNKFESSLPDITNPKDLDELYVGELKRRLNAEAASLSVELSTEVPSWEQVCKYFGVPKEDLDNLEVWLDSNLDSVIDANNRNFLRAGNLKDQTQVHLGSENLRNKAEILVSNHTEKMKNVLGVFFTQEPGLTEALARYPLIIDSWNNRSYFNWISEIVAICTQNVTYIRNGEIRLNPESFTGLFGHEVFGHARHHAITEISHNLPSFLRTQTNTPTESTAESIAQYLEQRFFDFLIKNPEASLGLGFEEPFEEIYKHNRDNRLIGEYRIKRYRFAILILAQSGPSAYEYQISTLSKYSPMEPKWPSNTINRLQNDWDKVTGRLMPRIVSELRYVADPVGRIVKNTDPNKLAEVEKLILTGFWLPQGLEDWVKLNIQANS